MTEYLILHNGNWHIARPGCACYGFDPARKDRRLYQLVWVDRDGAVITGDADDIRELPDAEQF